MASTLGNVNQVANPLMLGTVAGTIGSGGRLPDLWTFDFGDTAFGMAAPQVVGTGIEGGLPYIDVRFNGTPTAGAAGRMQIVFQHFVEGGSQARANAVYLKLAAGSLANCAVNTFANCSDTSNAYLTTLGFGARAITGASTKFPFTYTTDPATGYVDAAMSVSYTPGGGAVDVTPRIYLPQDERGATTHDLLISTPVNDGFFSRAIPANFFGSHVESPGAGGEPFPFTNGPYTVLSRGKSFNPECRWNDTTNPSAGVYNFSSIDAWIALIKGAGMIPVFTTFTGDSKPTYVGGTATNPTLAQWQTWVTALITRYGSQILVWEGINEVDGGVFYTGTKANAVTMQQYLYTTVKASVANSVVLGPSTTGAVTGIGYMRDLLVLGLGAYCDVFNYHSYNQGASYTPELNLAVNMAHLTMYRRFYGGTAKPIWDTEGSFAHPPAINSANKIDFLIKQGLLALSGGSEHTIWYATDNATYGTLWDATNGYNDTATALKILRAWTTGATPTGPATFVVNSNNTQWTMDFTRPGGYTARIIWDTIGESYTVPAGYTQYRDTNGNRILVTPGQVISPSDLPILLESSNALGTVLSGYILSPAQNLKTIWDTARDGALPGGSYNASPTVDGTYSLDFTTALGGQALTNVNSTGGYVTDNSGLMTLISANTPRRSNAGLLVEPAATNLVPSSQAFDAWTANNGAVVANNATAPDGTSTADTYTGTASAVVVHSVQSPNFSVTSGVTYGFAYDVVAGTNMRYAQLSVAFANFSGGPYVNVDLTNGTIVGSGGAPVSTAVETLANGFTRIKMSATATASGAACFVTACQVPAAGSLRGANGPASAVMVLSFAQAEALPAQAPGPVSSYLAGTRSADAVTILEKGAKSLTFTFDDNSTATVGTFDLAAQPVIPTNLPRRLIKSVTSSPTGLKMVATRGDFAVSSTVADANHVCLEARTLHTITDDAPAIQIVDAGFLLPVSGAETGISTTTIEHAIEIPSLSLTVRVLYSGANTGTIPLLAAEYISDKVLPSSFGLAKFARGLQFWVRTRRTITVGQSFPVYDTANPNSVSGEGAYFSDGTSPSQLMGSGTMSIQTGGSFTTNTSILPSAIIGDIGASIAVLGVGDSLMHGWNDNQGDGNSGGGWFSRGLLSVNGRTLASGRVARSQSQLNDYLINSTKRSAYYKYFTHAVVHYGTNDMVGGGRTAAQVMTDLQTLATTLKAAGLRRVSLSGILPRTSGGPTVAGQTPATNYQTGGTLRDALNTSMAASPGSNGIDEFFNMSSTICDATIPSPDKWNPAYYSDGIHYNAAGAAVMAPVFNAIAAAWVPF